MSKIQIKRGLNANRTGFTPAEGEPIYSSDNKVLYIGDNSTPGGVPVDKVPTVFGRVGDVVATSGDYTASQITVTPNTPSGTISSINVQDAIIELDSEKVPGSRIIATGTGLTGGGNLWNNKTISIANIGTMGTYTKVVTNAQGQVTSGTSLLTTDIPNLSGAYATTSGATFTGNISFPTGVSTNFIALDRVLVSNTAKQIIQSSITTTQLNTLADISSNVQTQLNLKANRSELSAYLPISGELIDVSDTSFRYIRQGYTANVGGCVFNQYTDKTNNGKTTNETDIVIAKITISHVANFSLVFSKRRVPCSNELLVEILEASIIKAVCGKVPAAIKGSFFDGVSPRSIPD
jgi:hypothetical protein